MTLAMPSPMLGRCISPLAVLYQVLGSRRRRTEWVGVTVEFGCHELDLRWICIDARPSVGCPIWDVPPPAAYRSGKPRQHLEILLHGVFKVLVVECGRRMIEGHDRHLSVRSFSFQNLAVQIADSLALLLVPRLRMLSCHCQVSPIFSIFWGSVKTSEVFYPKFRRNVVNREHQKPRDAAD